MYRTIVVGCDGSPEQADAIALAQRLRSTDGRLVLANVFPLLRALTGPALAVEYGNWLADRADETLAGAAASLLEDVPHETRKLAAPSAAAGLNDLAEMLDADLLVLGRSERSFVADLAGRKTIQRLLHGAPCAVAVAAHPAPEIRTIGVAYDASPEADVALAGAYAIAEAAAARVRLCSVIEPIVAAAGFVGVVDDAADEASVRAALDAAAARAPAGVHAEPRLVRGSPPWRPLLEAFADADLIVAGSRAYGPVHRALAGSTSAVLLKDARASVLVTPRVVARHASVPV